MAGGLTALTVTGAAVTLGGIAQAGNPPAGPGNIEIFAARDMVALEGYVEQAGREATVTVKRGDTVIGTGSGTVDSTGFLEWNHPGGSCWDIVTPDIRGGDIVEVEFDGFDFVDGAETSSAVIPKITDPATGETVTATKEAPPGVTDGAEWFWVKIAGTYDPAQRQPRADGVTVLDPSRFEVEIVNPDMREPGSTVGERAIGWSPVADPDPEEAPTTYTTQGSFNDDGTFEAYFGVQTEVDRELALAGEHVAVSWMAEGPGEELMLGTSLYEAGETNGPGFGECPPGPGSQDPIAPSTAALTTFDGNGNIQVDWTPATQAPDANDIVGYRVSAVDTSMTPSQEVSIEVGGDASTATLQGLNTGQAYEIQIEADNGQWSDPVTLGTATTGTAATTGGDTGGGTGGETPADPTDPAPSNVTATATATDSVDVSWTAAADAASYEVSLTPAGGEAVTQTVAAPATSATFTGLASGTEYTAAVSAVNTAGQSTPATETVSVTTLTAVAPGAATVVRSTSAHEAIALEWTAAEPANAASPVTGYDLVATPVGADGTDGTPVTAGVGAVTNGTITGLTNGTAYRVEVHAKNGDLRGPVSSNGSGVAATVTPNDQVTVSRAQYRAGRGEWKIQGTAQDTTANRVTVTTGGVTIQANVAVAADGSWSIDLRNGPQLSADRMIVVTSSSGAHLETTVTRSR